MRRLWVLLTWSWLRRYFYEGTHREMEEPDEPHKEPDVWTMDDYWDHRGPVGGW